MLEFLPRKFFERKTLEVAKDLLGKILLYNGKMATITETEAYVGYADPACHAANGKTKRNSPMFERAGYSYVYIIYGIHYCFNVVTEKKGFPAAVLIRGVKIDDRYVYGPGKLCKVLGIDKQQNNLDMINNKVFSICNNNLKMRFKTTPRIGIKKGLDKLWRFCSEEEQLDAKN